MNHETTFVDEIFRATGKILETATKTLPNVELPATKELAKRHIARMLGLRAAKIQPYPRRLRFA
ncbi:MAG: hypothetical protein ACREHC_03435 [Candidatus Levyibacteriota bacterium]